MNGRQVADMARLLKLELQVLFMTGHAANAALSHGHLPAGMQVLTKPFELDVFGQHVQTLIKSNVMSSSSKIHLQIKSSAAVRLFASSALSLENCIEQQQRTQWRKDVHRKAAKGWSCRVLRCTTSDQNSHLRGISHG